MTYTKLKEFSVVYTDRSLNHMSDEFVDIMKDISRVLKVAYTADSATIVPGSGTFGMEAVARQFANDKQVLIIRNGWFSYRWTQIFDMAKIASSVDVNFLTKTVMAFIFVSASASVVASILIS